MLPIEQKVTSSAGLLPRSNRDFRPWYITQVCPYSEVLSLLRTAMISPLYREPDHRSLWKKLEWILLVIVIIVEILVKIIFAWYWLLPWNLALLLAFAALGRLKPQQQWHQVIHTGVELGLILCLALVGKLPMFALLLVIAVIRNSLVREGRSRSIVTGLIILVYIVCYTQRLIHRDFFIQIHDDQIIPFWIGPIITFNLTIFFLQLLVNTVTTEQNIRRELAQANMQLQQYALKVEELATLQERNRIAREIHDSLGHTLTIFNFHLSAALRLFHSNPSKAENLLLEVKQLSDSALQEVSQSVTSLRTNLLHGQSLVSAITDLITKFQQTTGVVPQWEINIPEDLADRYQTAIYRITQESLTNMSKYAAMTEAKIQIYQADRAIHLLIQDNGRGFDVSKNTTGFGLQGIRERVMLLAGQLEITTAPHQGCQITVMLPLE
jgi:signal transduction histidine kinase